MFGYGGVFVPASTIESSAGFTETLRVNFQTIKKSNVFVIGNSNIIEGDNIYLIGGNNWVEGNNVRAYGSGNRIRGNNARTEGNDVVVNGDDAKVCGIDCTIFGVRGMYFDEHVIGTLKNTCYIVSPNLGERPGKIPKRIDNP